MLELLRVLELNEEMVKNFMTEYNSVKGGKKFNGLNTNPDSLKFELRNGNVTLGFLCGDFVRVADDMDVCTFNVRAFYIAPEHRRQGYAVKMLDELLGYMNIDSVIKPHDIKFHVYDKLLDMKILMYRYGFNHIDYADGNHIIFSYCRLRDILGYSLDMLSAISDDSGIYAKRKESPLLHRELGVSIVGDEFAIGTVVSGKQINLLSTNDIMLSHEVVADFLNQAIIDRLKNYITGI